MQKIKLKTEESGKKLLEAYAPPKWSETADDDETAIENLKQQNRRKLQNIVYVRYGCL